MSFVFYVIKYLLAPQRVCSCCSNEIYYESVANNDILEKNPEKKANNKPTIRLGTL